jgi:hypothetical protein
VFVGSSYGNFYVWTDTKANLTAKGIVLPCDNATYTIEVFGATPGTAAVVGPPAVPAVPNEITESWVSTPVTPPLSASTCTITAPTWSSIASPALAIDPIYAGKLAGHLTFTVRASNLAHPWTSNNWSLTYAGQLAGDATQYAGNAAIFPSPLAPPNPMIFTPMYHLDSTLLDSREPLDLPGWKWTDPVVSRAPVGFVSTPTP